MKYMLFLLMLISSISFAEVYKWVDEDGNTKFSQFPPEDLQIKSEELTITPQYSSLVDISEEQLIGSWRCISSDGNTFTVNFNEDRTMSIILKGKTNGEMQGSWSLQGVKLNNTLSGYLEKNRQRKYIKRVSGFEIFTFVSSDALKSVDESGNTTQYKRV